MVRVFEAMVNLLLACLLGQSRAARTADTASRYGILSGFGKLPQCPCSQPPVTAVTYRNSYRLRSFDFSASV